MIIKDDKSERKCASIVTNFQNYIVLGESGESWD